MKRKLKFLLTFIIVGSIILSALYMTNNKMFISTVEATTLTMSNVTDFSGTHDTNNGRTLARSSNGTLYSVCTNETTESGYPLITISESTDNGTTWSSSNLTFSFYDDLSYQSHDQNYPTIAIDSKNNIYVFWTESFDIGYIGYKVYNATNQSWDKNGTLDITAETTENPCYPACAVDSNDLVHIVFYSDNYRFIYHTTFDGMETGTTTFVSGVDNTGITDDISNAVHLARGLTQGIYNSVTELSYIHDYSPDDTEWSNISVAPEADPVNLSYTDWEDAVNGSPPDMVGNVIYMHIISEDRYFQMNFSSWQQGGGGGFGYTRYEVIGGVVGEGVEFLRPSATNDEATFSSISINSSDGINVVYDAQDKINAYQYVRYSSSDDSGSTWSLPYNVTSADSNRYIDIPIITINSSDIVFVSFVNFSYDYIEGIKSDGIVQVVSYTPSSGIWSEPLTVSTDSNIPSDGSCTISVDDNDIVNVVWVNYSSVSDSIILRPNGQVSGNDMWDPTPNVGSDHWENVNETVSDENTSYIEVSDSSRGPYDIWYLEDSVSPAGGVISYVKSYFVLYSPGFDSGVDTINLLCGDWDINMGNYWIDLIPAEYTTFEVTYDVSPIDSSPWTWNTVDDLELGIYGTMNISHSVRCTQAWIEVFYNINSTTLVYNCSTGSQWLTTPYITLTEVTLPTGSIFPNMIFASYPKVNNTPNIPYLGYALVYNNGTNLSFYSNCTWESVETPPIVSDESPPIGATTIDINLGTVNATITQTDGDLFDWTIEGGFLDANSSASDTTGVKRANVTGTLSPLTLYVWWVNATDDDGTTSETYYFTTGTGNDQVVFSNPNPANGSWGNNLSLTWNITMEDPEGDDFNWTIEVDDIGFNSDNYSTNGSKDLILSGLSSGTIYTVYVNATDENGSETWTNETFWFLTNRVAVLSNPNPANKSIGVSLSQPNWNITIEDPDGDTFNYSIEISYGVGGSFGNDNNNGSKNAVLVGLIKNTNYTVYVNVTDNGTDITVNKIYWFMTVDNYSVNFSNPNPANRSTGVSIATASWNITIEDPEGDSFNYSIETNPNVGGSYEYDNYNGSKSCVLAGLVISTNYSVYVNATDNATYGGNGTSVNETFWFYTQSYADIFVDDDAIPGWYDATHVATITEGIANASAGQVVFIYSGTYTENPTINKALTITSNETLKPQLNGLLTISEYLSVPINVEGLSINGGSGNAVYIKRADYVNITRCNLTSTFYYVILVCGRYCNISYCNITGGTFHTVYLAEIGSWTEGNNVIWYNNISGYTISPQSNACILCLETQIGGNTIVGNTIHNSTDDGLIMASWDTGNLIYHNNFIDNVNNVIVNAGSVNTWNLYYPICGNYWEGHGTQDIYSGTDQNQSGADLICDLTSPDPFIININNIDHYPFFAPFDGLLANGSTVILSNEIPANGSGNISLTLPNVSIDITCNVSFNYTITGIYINEIDNNATGVTNGTFTANITTPLPIDTLISWNVSVVDDVGWTNETYYFFTNRKPNVTNESPLNESTVFVQPTCHIDVTDHDGDLMDVCFYQNTSGSWVLNQTNLSVPNGTCYWKYFGASIIGNNYWWMVTVYDGNINVTNIYNFMTGGVWYNTTWWNGTILNTYLHIDTWSGNINNQTHGGIYNITIFFENETEGVNHRVDLEQKNTGIHKFIIHYADGIDYVYFNNNGVSGSHYTTIAGYFNNNRSGNFTLVIDKQVKYFEFRWNDSTGRIWYCTRYTVPTANNVSMYIRTDLPVYGETTFAFNPSLVQYTLSFNDETGKFLEQNNPYVYFYIYNSSGVREIIDAEYMDAESHVYPMLVYNDKYYIGVSCDVLTIDRIGDFVATSNTAQTDVRIPFQGAMTYTIYDLCTITAGWYAGGLYVDYVDTTFGTVAVECTIYYYINESLFLFKNYTYTDTQNFTFDLIEGINLTSNYKYQINTTLSGSTNSMFQGYYETGKCPIFAGISPITNNNTIDTIFTIIFGPSPIYNHDDPSIFVPWAYILVFIVSFVLMASFGKLNAFIGGLAVGLFLIFAGTTITGLNALYTQYPGWPGPTTVIIGAFITAISVISLIGGVEKR